MLGLLALSDAIEARDPYTRGHSVRVARMAHAIGMRLGFDEAELALLGLCGALHDVGKLFVPEAVLNKAGPLTVEELAEVRGHPEAGARMVALDRQLRPALAGVLYHHERWDGAGYPTGRAGASIPIEARILAVVDSFDAMTSDRPYRLAITEDEAVAELARCRGTQFDPRVVDAFLEIPAWEWEHIRLEVETVAVLSADLAERPPIHEHGAPTLASAAVLPLPDI